MFWPSAFAQDSERIARLQREAAVLASLNHDFQTWPSHLGKQVRIEGPTTRLSAAESDSYFGQRPLESQITAAVSRQSRALLDEREFLERLQKAERNGSIERPAEWGGFKLIPTRYEFWVHGEHR